MTDSNEDMQKVRAAFPDAKAIKMNLAMDSVEVTVSTTHGSAHGFFMQDVEAMAWADAARKLAAVPEPAKS